MNLLTLEQQALAGYLQNKGYTKFEIETAIDHWTSQLPSSFKFKTSFPATDAHCKSIWGSRVFQHTDWIDGTSLVQAGQTPNEEGFNTRFHDIENDLDRLGTSIGTAFECLAEQRAAVAQLMNEIAAQFDLIAAVIASCCKRVSTTTPSIEGGSYVGGIRLDEDVELVAIDTADGHIAFLPKGGWPPPPPPPLRDGVYDPMRSRAAMVMRIFAANPAIATAFGGAVTKGQLIKQFGDTRVDGGPTLAEVLEVLPSSVPFKTLNGVAAAIAEIEGGVLKATTGGDAVIRGSFREPVDDVAKASIDDFAAISIKARTALSDAGIKTVGDLANSAAAKVDAALEQAGVPREPGDSGAMIGAARLMGYLD